MTNLLVDNYLLTGCGRCPLGNTPACKVHRWPHELLALRQLVLECGLTEELKWGSPCYTYAGRNELMIAAFNQHATLSFFHGVLLNDPMGLLQKPGENSQAGRVIRFTSVEQVYQHSAAIKDLIAQVKEHARLGTKPVFEKQPTVLPEELIEAFEQDPAFHAAFEALTPGRQRGYLLHFSQPKQSKTRSARIEKCMPRILEGKGMQD
jgi:uncharacterized protein YdeI (YjbR/CyaY-like superfamily)